MTTNAVWTRSLSAGLSFAACAIAAFLLSATGCGDDDDVPPSVLDAGTDLGSAEADAGTAADASTVPDDGAVPVEVRLTFTLPNVEPFYTRTSAVFQLVATGGRIDEIELWRDGAIFGVLAAPFTYSWDASLEPEGTYVFEARGFRAGLQVASATRTVISDRTAPRIVRNEPTLGTAYALDRAVEVEFSEPLLPSTVSALSASLDVTPRHWRRPQTCPRTDARSRSFRLRTRRFQRRHRSGLPSISPTSRAMRCASR